MTHVRRLTLTGKTKERGLTVGSAYSWPDGERVGEVERIIHSFRNTYDSVTVVIQHHYID